MEKDIPRSYNLARISYPFPTHWVCVYHKYRRRGGGWLDSDVFERPTIGGPERHWEHTRADEPPCPPPQLLTSPQISHGGFQSPLTVAGVQPDLFPASSRGPGDSESRDEQQP